MKFEVVPDSVRDQVINQDLSGPRRIRSPFVAALIDGKTIKLRREDRKRIGGNVATLKARGLRLRTALINETEVIAWAVPRETEGS